jgi:hypothetical protein
VTDKEVRIIGSKSNLLQTLVTASPGKPETLSLRISARGNVADRILKNCRPGNDE